MRTRIWLILALLASTAPALAQQRPLTADDPELLAVGRVRMQFGIEFLQDQRFPVSGLEGDLTRLGVGSIHVGVGEYAEFQISGVVRDFLSVTRRTTPAIPPDFAGSATSDVGDLVLGTKLRLVREDARRPAIAFKFAVQLPNASNESGLGNDVTGFRADVLLAKQVGATRLVGNVGLAILGSPVRPNSQDDLLTFGFGMIVPVHPQLSLVGEIQGRQGPDNIGNENQAQLRMGIQLRAAGLRWDLGAIAGLRRVDADSGVAVGVTYEFQAFKRDRSPKTIR